MNTADNPALSVVIPMYNCEAYVNDLLHSLSCQTFTDFEVICVNDGSTDNTLALLEAFCAKDSRFHFITKENGGAGSARNAGIDAARGKYMLFLDADDEYFPDFFREMVETAENHLADEVFCLLEEVNCKTNTVKHIGFNKKLLPPGTLVSTESIEKLYRSINKGPLNALYRKDLIDQYNLRFSTTIVGNDIFFICSYASVTKHIIGIHKELLRVRRYHNSNSLTSDRWLHTEDVVSVFEQLYFWLIDNQLPEKLVEQCRELFIISLNYNGSFPYNEKFIKTFARCICKSDMWKGIDNHTFYEKYWNIHDTEKLQHDLLQLREEKTNVLEQSQILSNHLLAVQEIEKEAYLQYGRILNPHRFYRNVLSLQKEKNTLQEENKQISTKLNKTEKALQKAKQKTERVKTSWNYRIGSYITWLPRKVYHGISGNNKNDHTTPVPIKVSVIIPVYNAEKYIRPFLDSLVSHRSKELEFIFVDDCGSDSSMRIVKEYAERDSRIRIFRNKTNMGPGPSRNHGIEVARGEFLAFADPDDLVTRDCYEEMYDLAIAEKAEVVRGDVRVFDEKGNDITPSKKFFLIDTIKDRIKKGMPLYAAITNCHWSMLYSHELFLDNSVRYGNTMVGEDGLFLLHVFLKAKSISFYEKPIYLYSMRSDGLFSKGSLERCLSQLESLEERIKLLKSKGLDDDSYRYIRNYTTFCMRTTKDYYMKLKKKDEIRLYLEKLEQIVGKVDDPSRILNGLQGYTELKHMAE